MRHSKPEASVSCNIMKFAAAAAAMALLGSCAVAVPLRPLAISSQDSRDRDFACAIDSKCPRTHRVASRRSQPVGSGKLELDPPDFILHSQDGTPR
jgi:hypothetical protein